MDHEDSEPSEYKDREDIDWEHGVHIRHQDRGIIIYAVFDGEEQVSDEFGPGGDNECIAFADGYSKAKRKYEDYGEERLKDERREY